MFSGYENYYYVVLALQVICVIHCLRRRTANYWIWLIVFVPLIGCLAYLFLEVLSKRDMQGLQANITQAINPSGRIKELERRLEFSDSFDNKVALADAYLQAGRTDEAIALYESCKTGIFKDNELLLMRLIIAYSEKERYSDVAALGGKLGASPDFRKTHAHVLYALSLEQLGRAADAEKEFRTMLGRFSDFEGRYQYGRFLLRAGRKEEARELYAAVMQEAAQMSGREKRHHAVWIDLTREALRGIS